MNRSARTAETVSDVYLALMLSAFLLWTGPDGYTKILEAKYRLFLLLTIVYCAAAALSALRQIRTVCFCKLLRAVRPAEWLMLGYVLCSLLSTFLSPWRADAWLGLSRREGLLTLALYGAVFLLLGRLARPKAWLLDVFGAAMSLCCLLALWQLAGGNPLGLYPKGLAYSDAGTAYSGAYLGTIGNTDLLAAVMCVAVPAFFYGAWKLRRCWLLVPLTLCVTVSVRMKVSAGLLGTAAGLVLPLRWRWTKSAAQRQSSLEVSCLRRSSRYSCFRDCPECSVKRTRFCMAARRTILAPAGSISGKTSGRQ